MNCIKELQNLGSVRIGKALAMFSFQVLAIASLVPSDAFGDMLEANDTLDGLAAVTGIDLVSEGSANENIFDISCNDTRERSQKIVGHGLSVHVLGERSWSTYFQTEEEVEKKAKAWCDSLAYTDADRIWVETFALGEAEDDCSDRLDGYAGRASHTECKPASCPDPRAPKIHCGNIRARTADCESELTDFRKYLTKEWSPYYTIAYKCKISASAKAIGEIFTSCPRVFCGGQ